MGELFLREPWAERLCGKGGNHPPGWKNSVFRGKKKTIVAKKKKETPFLLLTKPPEVCRILYRWVVSSVEERFPDAEEVTGSNPVPPTI